MAVAFYFVDLGSTDFGEEIQIAVELDIQSQHGAAAQVPVIFGRRQHRELNTLNDLPELSNVLFLLLMGRHWCLLLSLSLHDGGSGFFSSQHFCPKTHWRRHGAPLASLALAAREPHRPKSAKSLHTRGLLLVSFRA